MGNTSSTKDDGIPGMGSPTQPATGPLHTDHVLDLLSTKLEEWQTVIGNMGKDRMPDADARPYLIDLMKTSQGQLSSLIRRYEIPGRSTPDTDRRRQEQQGQQQGHRKGQQQGQPQVSRNDTASCHVCQQRSVMESRMRQDYDKLQRAWAARDDEHNARVERMNEEKRKLKQDLDDALSRLSKVASNQLLRSNAFIADLSDPNRPTKLGEMYRELYDNQWTDAFEALQANGRPDRHAIDILRDTLMDVVGYCQWKADRQFRRLVEDFKEELETSTRSQLSSEKKCQTLVVKPFEHGKALEDVVYPHGKDCVVMTSHWRKQKRGSDPAADPAHQLAGGTRSTIKVQQKDIDYKAKKFRKDLAEALLPCVVKAYLRARWDESCIPQLKPYIKQCLRVGWLMSVQIPPMALYEPDSHGADFNKDVYSHYMRTGTSIDYVLWPALLLRAGTRELVAKGVAEGTTLK